MLDTDKTHCGHGVGRMVNGVLVTTGFSLADALGPALQLLCAANAREDQTALGLGPVYHKNAGPEETWQT